VPVNPPSTTTVNTHRTRVVVRINVPPENIQLITGEKQTKSNNISTQATNTITITNQKQPTNKSTIKLKSNNKQTKKSTNQIKNRLKLQIQLQTNKSN
jgi:hypothetical protein